METNNSTGFIYDEEIIEKVVSSLPKGIFGAAAPHLKESGKGVTRLLTDSFGKIGMQFPLLNQGPYGTCTSEATSGGIDVLKATEIALGERSEFKAITASEPIYYGARKLGGFRYRGDGASVALAIKYIAEYGTIVRGKYGNIDLTTYSGERARKWGSNSGFPKTIEDISKEHIVQQYARVRSYEEARDSIANGYPVIVGSNYGFSNKCNNDGIAAQNTSWSHAMYMAGIRADKQLVLIINSWGDWNHMPVRKFNEPLGSFWVTADVAHKMCANGDAWSISQHEGYPLKIDSKVAW